MTGLARVGINAKKMKERSRSALGEYNPVGAGESKVIRVRSGPKRRGEVRWHFRGEELR